ncbi:MAG TPA: BlaI/MecI/CopY family transcriptional regulator [Bryobacteraceae bacterium]|nr:BlaI/MecI/CopY family transcriptional regulator [Bryobacteraceae bacterium]
MRSAFRIRRKPLSELEQRVMDYVWQSAPCTADACREALAADHPLKDSTIRTVLSRLEAKDYVTHSVEGRTNLYKPCDPPQKVAAHAVRQIIDRFCSGSVEELLVGMVDDQVLDQEELQRLAVKIAAARKGKKS